ncbi:conserved protein of unknown function [Tenacibaculum sp. 190130A14a]|uniref:Uncharacterized protein n=1 Tax=Tenacibaculum polynesiense TaxID=3137857 RepID=A0ABM9PCD7_9FLAO
MKNLRGKALDLSLKKELDKMIDTGYKLAPITRSNLQRRLGLNSRGTLAVKHRAEMIRKAKEVQLNNAGLDIRGKKKRNTLKQQNELLKKKIIQLESQRDQLVEQIAMIINGAQARGYNVDEIMMPIIKIDS